MTVEIIHGDCMEYLAGLKENEFDLAVVDPPYGIFGKEVKNKKDSRARWSKSGTGGTWASKYGKQAEGWDTPPPQEYFDLLRNASKDQIVWGANYFGIVTGNFVVWRKTTISENFTMGMAEFASVTCPGNSKVFDHRPQDPGRFHPTQKPVALYRWIFRNYAKPGMRILDTHLGSGSSAIAAHYEGLDFVGIELDEDYYKAAKKRFEKETRQETLFAKGDL